jgi:carboxyl-terminal processing protease
MVMADARRRQLPRLLAGLVACLCLAYAAGFGAYRLREQVAQGARSANPEVVRVLWEAWDRVEKHFYGPLPSVKARTYGAIRTSLELLDPYTVFVEPQPRELERDQLRGVYGGIGVAVWRDGEGQIALDPFPESPAARAGLRKGDVLLAIDGEPVTAGTGATDVEAELHGDVGTDVTVTISRPTASVLDVTITREQIERPSVTWRQLTANVGYIGIERFTERTYSEVEEALRALERAQATELVLDLRSNAGGLVDAAVAIAGLFLQEGDVVLYQSGRAGERIFRAKSGNVVALPLVVLVDGGTASAAEIVAGALQGHDRAVLVGDATFGKGSVQEIYDLTDGSSVHITAAVWLTPDRHQIDSQGLMPDIPVQSSDGPRDEQLDRALFYLESES